MASTSGVVDEAERKMIHSVFELGDTLVREVMVPRPDVVWVERDTAVDKVLRLALRSGYSRLPVLGENIDDVIGVAYLKDLVQAQAEQPGRRPDRRHAARGVRARQQADRRAAQGDAAHPQPHGDRRRRVRRHRRRRHDRGHPRGDRRGDHRRVRRRRGARRRPARRRPAAGRRPGCPSKTCRSSTACSRRAATSTRARPRSCGPCWRRRTSTRSAACSPSSSAGCRCRARRSRSRGCTCSPRAARTRAGGVRITTVLITPVHEDADVSGRSDGTSSASDAPKPRARRPPNGRLAAHSRRRRRRLRRQAGGGRCPARLISTPRTPRSSRWPGRRGAHRRRRGGGRPRHRRPHLRRGDRRVALAVADGAAGRGRRRGVQRCAGPGGGHGRDGGGRGGRRLAGGRPRPRARRPVLHADPSGAVRAVLTPETP